jgi:hypothetical protein
MSLALAIFSKTALFAPEKPIIGPFQGGHIAFSLAISKTSRGPTPLRKTPLRKNIKSKQPWLDDLPEAAFIGNPVDRLAM